MIVTAVVGVCAEFLVSAIEEVTKIWHISETFVGKSAIEYLRSMTNTNLTNLSFTVGLILIPIVGNAAEHLTAVTCALKNKVIA